MKRIKKYVSPILLLSASVIWGFAFSAQKAAEKVPAFTLGAVRSLFGAVFLVFAVMAFDKINKTDRQLFSRKKPLDFTRIEIVGGIICGSVLTVASFFQQHGINSGADAGKASFITALYVVLVPIYALVRKTKAPVNVWIAMPIAVVGFYLLCVSGEFEISTPDLLVFVCALVFPIHILTIDALSPRCDGVRMSCLQFFTATVLNLILALIFESPINFSEIKSAILPLLFLGVFSSGIAYTLQIIGQRGANPAAASIILSLESVFGVMGSALFLGEKMLLREYLGCAVVFTAVIISQLDFKKIFKK